MGRPGHEHYVTPLRPILGSAARHTKVERRLRRLRLELPSPDVGSTAKDDGGSIFVSEKGLEAIRTQIGVHGDRIGVVALKSLPGVERCRVADIPALGVQNH